VRRIRTELRQEWQRLRGHPIMNVVQTFNPIIRGQANYFRVGVASETFSSLDNWMFLRAFREVRQKHPATSLPWRHAKYWGRPRKEGTGGLATNRPVPSYGSTVGSLSSGMFWSEGGRRKTKVAPHGRHATKTDPVSPAGQVVSAASAATVNRSVARLSAGENVVPAGDLAQARRKALPHDGHWDLSTGTLLPHLGQALVRCIIARSSCLFSSPDHVAGKKLRRAIVPNLRQTLPGGPDRTLDLNVAN
jgi:hypothetical protein